MIRWFFYLWCAILSCSWCIPSHAYSKIYSINSINELEQYINDDTLVIFDLDRTLFEGKTHEHGQANFLYDLMKKGRDLGEQDKKILAKFLPNWFASQESNIKPIEDITPQLIQKLQSQGISIIGFTTRAIHAIAITLRQLESINVTFNFADQPPMSLDKEFSKSTHLSKGVIFCSECVNRGKVLRDYIQALQLNPSKIIIVEDSLHNIQTTITAFADWSTKVIGLYYPLVANKHKTTDDFSQARREYYAAFLQNQNLPQLFVEKKDYSVTIDELLAKNLEITQPYKFIVDNHYFIGLPGVFSPEIFGGVMRAQLAIPIKNGADVLEIGPGTGYFPVLAVLAGANQVIAIDINHTAVANTRLNAKRYQLEHKIKVHQGDIFAPLKDKERFDVIFWNIPFSHSDKDQLSELEQSIYDPNHLLLTRYLSEAYHYLKPNGVLYLGYSPSHGDIDYLCTLAQHLQLEFNTLYKVGRSEELQFALYAFKKKPTVN